MKTVLSVGARLPKSKSKPSWPRILRRVYPSGQVAYQIGVMVNGIRTRETFKTRDEADTRAEQMRVARQNEGTAAFSLATDVRVEAAKGTEMLRPYSATITEACQYYVDHVLRYRTAPSIDEIVEKMIADAGKANRRPDTIAELRQRLGQFAVVYGDRQLTSITFEEVEQWIGEANSPRSRINRRRKLGQLFNFAIRRKWAEENLALLVTPPDYDDQEPGILSVEQCAHLLEHATKFNLLPYITLGLFAGLRASELERMEWSKVKLAGRIITVDATASKVRSRRNVEINDTLAACLKLCTKKSGPVVNLVSFLDRRKSLAMAAGITDWPHNALRHSFGSYHLAMHNDDLKTAFQMGNSPTMVHRHYKALVTKSEAERFWALRPVTAADDKIVEMKAATA